MNVEMDVRCVSVGVTVRPGAESPLLTAFSAELTGTRPA